MRENRWRRLEPKVVYFVCHEFVTNDRTADWIAEEVERRFEISLHRTQVYQVILEGRRRRYFYLTPPREEHLSERMADRFAPSVGASCMTVVPRASLPSLDAVANAASLALLREVKEVHAQMREGKRPVHVGFGAGETMMLVARHFAERLRMDERSPNVVLHALSSGANILEPATAPVAFFSFFDGIPGVSFTGLFASSFVDYDDWEKERGNVGVHEAFAEKEKLQVVVTALADAGDEHGELNRLLAHPSGKHTRDVLDQVEGRVGDVLYRPFTQREPITRQVGIRAVSLFEIAELVTFAASKEKRVLLVAGPCGGCGRSRSKALLPLLTQPALRVWSHVVTDEATALACLNPPFN